MIATISSGLSQYHHTVNTLKYADRAKEIKTHVRRNTASVAVHVAQMRNIILQLQQQNNALKAMLNSPAVGPWLGLQALCSHHACEQQSGRGWCAGLCSGSRACMQGLIMPCCLHKAGSCLHAQHRQTAGSSRCYASDQGSGPQGAPQAQPRHPHTPPPRVLRRRPSRP